MTFLDAVACPPARRHIAQDVGSGSMTPPDEPRRA
jgi:hypothetical protein